MPMLLLAVLWPLSAFADPAFAPRFQWHLFAIGLVAGSFEELGWTGFATPRLLSRHRLFMAGLSLGLLWALWHLLVDFRQNFNTMGLAWLLEFTILYMATLSAYRVLMTWVYANTFGSRRPVQASEPNAVASTTNAGAAPVVVGPDFPRPPDPQTPTALPIKPPEPPNLPKGISVR